MSPNEALIGCRVQLLLDIIIQLQNPLVNQQITQVKEKRAQAIAALNQAAQASLAPQSRFELEIWCGSRPRTSKHNTRPPN